MNQTSTGELAAFVLLGGLAVVSAIVTVALRNPIRCAMGLFVHVLALAGLYLALSAHFLAAVQLIVYVGAVVVLFVFVIMLLGPTVESPRDPTGRLPRAIGAASMALVGLMIAQVVAGLAPERLPRPMQYGTLREIGGYLFGPAMIPFELASILLTAAIVGAFAVARGHHHTLKTSAKPSAEVPAPRPGEHG